MRIAPLPNERWMVKAAEWNPELSSRYKTYRAIGRPRRRWEDDINEFFKLEENETENSTESENKSWIKAEKDSGRCILCSTLRTPYVARLQTQTNGRKKWSRNILMDDQELTHGKLRRSSCGWTQPRSDQDGVGRNADRGYLDNSMCGQPKSVKLGNHAKMRSRPLRLTRSWSYFRITSQGLLT